MSMIFFLFLGTVEQSSASVQPGARAVHVQQFYRDCGPVVGGHLQTRASSSDDEVLFNFARGRARQGREVDRPRMHGRARGNGRCVQGRGQRPEDDMVDSSEDSSTASSEDSDWKKEDIARSIPPFGGTQGPRVRMSPEHTAKDFFELFFDSTIMDMLVKQTNLNAERKRAGGQHRGKWHDVTVMELKAFIGLSFITGILRLPTLSMYWQKHQSLIDVPAFNEVMPRDRFFQINRYLHVCDEEEKDPNDKLYKIRPLLKLINENYAAKYDMGKEISIDESLIPYKGRLSFRQFIPSKRARFGIKTWVKADASNGYVSQFVVYTGRDASADTKIPLATRVVQKLMEPNLHMNHHLYVDNFYSSPDLFLWLNDRGVQACGTVRKNRLGFPHELYFGRGRHQRGSSNFLTKPPLLAQSWYDSKEVYFLSTIHEGKYPATVPADQQSVIRKGPNGPMNVVCPPLLHDYNKYMGGVDLVDNVLKHYSCWRKTRRWYRRILFYIVEVSANNAYVLENFVSPHIVQGKEKRGILQFRLDLAQQLIAPFQQVNIPRSVGRPRVAEEERLINTGAHHPALTPGAANNKNCQVCSHRVREELRIQYPHLKASERPRQHIRRSNVWCTKCKVHLCLGNWDSKTDRPEPGNCWYLWHHIVEYWK